MIKKLIRIAVLWKFRSAEMTETEQIAEFERARPRLKVIYEHSNAADPTAMLVMRGRTKVGYVNADDKRWLVPLMKASRRGVMIDFDHVVLPQMPGESAILKYSINVDETAVLPFAPSTGWDEWFNPFPQLDTTDSMDALDYAFEEMEAIMDGADDVALTLDECVDMICENCRYDLSVETTARLDACCFALEMHAEHDNNSTLLERIETASTHRRGRRGVEEWREWFDNLVKSQRADRLVMLYKNECRRRMDVSRVTRQQIARDVQVLEKAILTLPDHLDLFIDDPAQLMHMAYYRHITDVKQLELLSALVLRARLKALAAEDDEETTTTTAPATTTEMQQPTREPAALFTPKAMQLWEKLQAKGLVDEDFQPTISMRKASVIASVMGGQLGLSPLWEPFEALWDAKNMANSFSQAQISKYYGELIKSVMNALN